MENAEKAISLLEVDNESLAKQNSLLQKEIDELKITAAEWAQKLEIVSKK